MDTGWLLLSMFYSTVGLGMFIYGKKAVRFVPSSPDSSSWSSPISSPACSG